jgi:iron uptake system component EfeO
MKRPVVAGAGTLLLAVLAGCSTPAPQPTTVEVTRGGCGTGWAEPHGGAQTIEIHNVGTVTMEVELTDPATHGVYAETEALGPGTTRPMALVLGPGSYAFTCFPDESDAETGATVTIKDGPATGGMVAVPPTSETDLTASVTSYRAHVTTGLAALAARSAELRTAIGGGDRGKSRAAWLAAQLAYSRLGAAYDTFGDSAVAIDGLPAGLPGGVHDKDFTGLRRIEWGLWHNEAMGGLKPIAAGLVDAVASLRKDFADERTDPNDLPLRSHEILENSLQFELTGDADQGAGDGLAIIGANLEGTRAVLAAIAPVVRPKYSGWAGVQTDLGKMTTLINAQHSKSGWTAPAALPALDREKLSGTLGELLERLAPIAAIGEVRRVAD